MIGTVLMQVWMFVVILHTLILLHKCSTNCKVIHVQCTCTWSDATTTFISQKHLLHILRCKFNSIYWDKFCNFYLPINATDNLSFLHFFFFISQYMFRSFFDSVQSTTFYHLISSYRFFLTWERLCGDCFPSL